MLELKEKEIQKQILEWLEWKSIFHYRNNTGAMTGKHKGKTWFLRFGAVGSPDIIAVHKGKYIGIEVKGKNGVQSEKQKEFQERLEQAGGIYILAYCLEDVIKNKVWITNG